MVVRGICATAARIEDVKQQFNIIINGNNTTSTSTTIKAINALSNACLIDPMNAHASWSTTTTTNGDKNQSFLFCLFYFAAEINTRKCEIRSKRLQRFAIINKKNRKITRTLQLTPASPKGLRSWARKVRDRKSLSIYICCLSNLIEHFVWRSFAIVRLVLFEPRCAFYHVLSPSLPACLLNLVCVMWMLATRNRTKTTVNIASLMWL